MTPGAAGGDNVNSEIIYATTIKPEDFKAIKTSGLAYQNNDALKWYYQDKVSVHFAAKNKKNECEYPNVLDFV